MFSKVIKFKPGRRYCTSFNNAHLKDVQPDKYDKLISQNEQLIKIMENKNNTNMESATTMFKWLIGGCVVMYWCETNRDQGMKLTL